MMTKLHRIFTIVLILAGFQTAFAQYTGRSVREEPESVSVLYSNGGYQTGSQTESGVAAPDGYFWSENQHDAGNMTEANTSLGYGATFTPNGNRLADNFTVPAGERWTITSVTLQGYVSGWTTPASPFSGATLQIWNGVPGEEGSSVIFGDTTTDRLASSTSSNSYVIRNTVAPSSSNPSQSSPLWTNKLSVSPGLTLGPGTYWIDFQASSFNASGVFFRPVLNKGTRTMEGWDARQYKNSTGIWSAVFDAGTPSAAPDVAQDIAFDVSGFNAVPSGSAFGDFDGDGTTDFSATRWGTTSTASTDWLILHNNGNSADYSINQFGIRAGTHRVFSGAAISDIVVPADYDGDGKTDIAVYRGGATAAAPQSYFYILNSSDGTFRAEPWGTRNDVANIMGDYDGDGKADLAVYRPGAQSAFYVKKSSDGEMLAANWGVSSDRHVIGDYDGDGKMDFSVVRVSSTDATATLYTLRSSDGEYMATPVAYPFIFMVPGDYDGDGTTDVATLSNKLDRFEWKIKRSSDGVTETVEAGQYSTDYPVQGDYNGDGKDDIAVFRHSGTGTAPAYFIVRNDDGSYNVTPWGNSTDSSIGTIRVY